MQITLEPDLHEDLAQIKVPQHAVTMLVMSPYAYAQFSTVALNVLL